MDKDIRCKYCNNKYIEQIPVGSAMHAWFSWLPLNYFHCEVCLQKFYKLDRERISSRLFNDIISITETPVK